MKITIRQLTGLWFAMGSVMGVLVFVFKTYDSASSFLSIVLALFTAFCSAYYFGQQWGMLIIDLDANLKNALKSIVYGIIVGVCTLYFIILVLTTVSYFQTQLLDTLKMGNYFQACVELLEIPFLSAFASIIGCLFEPLVLILSCTGGVLLYLLRYKLLRLVRK